MTDLTNNQKPHVSPPRKNVLVSAFHKFSQLPLVDRVMIMLPVILVSVVVTLVLVGVALGTSSPSGCVLAGAPRGSCGLKAVQHKAKERLESLLDGPAVRSVVEGVDQSKNNLDSVLQKLKLEVSKGLDNLGWEDNSLEVDLSNPAVVAGICVPVILGLLLLVGGGVLLSRRKDD